MFQYIVVDFHMPQILGCPSALQYANQHVEYFDVQFLAQKRIRLID